jgi:hypothetical protein
MLCDTSLSTMGRPRSGKSNRKVGRGASCAAESVVVTFRASGGFQPLTRPRGMLRFRSAFPCYLFVDRNCALARPFFLRACAPLLSPRLRAPSFSTAFMSLLYSSSEGTSSKVDAPPPRDCWRLRRSMVGQGWRSQPISQSRILWNFSPAMGFVQMSATWRSVGQWTRRSSCMLRRSASQYCLIEMCLAVSCLGLPASYPAMADAESV